MLINFCLTHFNSIKVRLERSLGTMSVDEYRHFNSIKVRLELPAASHREGQRTSFQFHKGTIRTGVLLSTGITLLYFNSIKVRLELFPFSKFYLLLIHFNSIKVRLEPGSAEGAGGELWQFQFHKGTIRTPSVANHISSLPHFNSIKVRLEPIVAITFTSFVVNFNSIKVRLEPLSFSSLHRSCAFQFHKGTIRTGIQDSTASPFVISIP